MPIVVEAFIVASLLPVLSISAARPLEAAMLVRRPVVVIPAVVFVVSTVTPVFFLLLFFFLRIVVILVRSILSVLVPTPIRVFGSFKAASLVVSAWRSLGFHVSYDSRMPVQHVIFALLHHVGFRVAYRAVNPHVTVHGGVPGIEANGTLYCFPEITFFVLG